MSSLRDSLPLIWPALILSVKITIVTSGCLLVIGLGLGIFLAKKQFPGKILISTVLSLPLALPPVIVGYFLLLGLGRSSPLQSWLGIDLLFTWQAAAIAATVVALPLMVESTRAAIENVDPELEMAARTLGSTEIGLLWQVTIPLAYRGILAGFGLSVARGLGEFGATLMIAGNIPGRTQTMPLAIYHAVQTQQYTLANIMVLIMTILAFLVLWWVRFLESHHPQSRGKTTSHPKREHR
ncbi:molybdate ABC transporter permease subunit [Candidatus Synechococcus calcipolaris G9]|uniref:Molybdenum transport system permease n=1 Tax=Candidatus Synechococcus calcipolaris G9 TaxID=1497997 RepID=A0ABT6EUB0_9SYNE|nr:molybdate ABC transporter permease subunit [Candidatus Synechococcus calcipolaris]MDG2989476.1 molybdate ABC transporter permease subunit [Candidatus Synechococcus calcipolaris G9]